MIIKKNENSFNIGEESDNDSFIDGESNISSSDLNEINFLDEIIDSNEQNDEQNDDEQNDDEQNDEQDNDNLNEDIGQLENLEKNDLDYFKKFLNNE